MKIFLRKQEPLLRCFLILLHELFETQIDMC